LTARESLRARRKEKMMSKVASKARQVGMTRAFAAAFAAAFAVMVAVALLMTTASTSLATTAPAAPVIVSPPEGSYDNDGAFTLSGTALTNSGVKVFEVFDDGKTSHRGTVEVSATGEWALPLQGVGEGKHSYKAYSSGSTGVSDWSNTRTVTVDTKAPAAPTLRVGSGGGMSSYTNGDIKDGWLGGRAEAGSKVEVFFQDTLMSTVSSGPLAWEGSNWTTPAVFTLNSANDASYYFKARATDLAGNVSGWSNAIQIRVDCVSDGCPVARGRGG
jgi:hypothetical protein